MKLKKTTLVFLLFLTQIIFTAVATCEEAEVFYVDIAVHGQNEAEEVKLACDLLGIRFATHFINTTNNATILNSIRELRGKEVLILSARALQYFNKDNFLLLGQGARTTKILISSIDGNTDIAYLKLWSKNKIKNCRKYLLAMPSTSIKVIENKQIARELGGLEYSLSGSGSAMINGFELADAANAVSLIEVLDESRKPLSPVFIKTDSGRRSVFFLTSWEKELSDETNSFLRIMPILMFLKYSFGDRCWHGINDYANLTIDDPWLREPFGYISFADLCSEARKAYFHVTIGFIPYNYQKSHNDAIEIFQQCQKNLSIAVHGNNHDLSEFHTGRDARLNDKKLSDIDPNEKNILQALYRMDTFSRKTGLSYDRVMIFPRGTFTKESLRLLKKHNFLMTVNSTRPLNAGPFANKSDQMRGITLEFENFPMVMRSGLSDWKNDKRAMAVEKSWIQMRLFLDLPVLLYTHHAFFKGGADKFNNIADLINKVQPETIWTGLGNIAKKLYLQKRNDEQEVEILAYSSDIVIKNNYPVTMKYVVKKQEDFVIPIQSVEVNGTKHKYSQDGNQIRVEVVIEPGCEKNIRILYYSAYQVGSFTFSDGGLRTYFIRTISDLRDIYLSKLPFGDRAVTILYGLGGVIKVSSFILGLIAIFLILLILRGKHRKSKKIFSQNNLQ